MTPELAIEGERRRFAALVAATRHDPGKYGSAAEVAAGWPQAVLWEGGVPLAVLRSLPDGMTEVVRLDPPGAAIPPGLLRMAREQFAIALDRREQARADMELARKHEGSRPADHLFNLAVDALDRAEDRLILAILTLGRFRGFDARTAMKRRWPARGVRFGGRYYIATPDPGQADREEGGPDDLMALTVVDAEAVVDLDRPGDGSPAG